jgi:hypothetical protein
MLTAVDDRAAEEKSRLVLVSFTALSMRLMENWRQLISDVSGRFPDYEKTMILGAIITAEKLTRADLEPGFHSLSDPFPSDRLTKCNITSVAAAVRLNSETVRRRINELSDLGLVIREPSGSIQIGAGLLELPAVRDTLQAQLELLRRTTNQLINYHVVQVQRK